MAIMRTGRPRRRAWPLAGRGGVDAPSRDAVILPPGELRRSALDISTASSALAWKPWTHLEDGLAETVAWAREGIRER